jgi:hypothetical protein
MTRLSCGSCVCVDWMYSGCEARWLPGCEELLDGQVGRADQRPQSTLGHTAMVRNGERGHVAVLREDDVASALPRDVPTQGLKDPYDLAAAQRRKRWHLDRHFDLPGLDGKRKAPFGAHFKA